MITVELHGLNEAISNLNWTDEQLRHADEPMRAATSIVSSTARQNAPVDTNVLKASIMPKVISRDKMTTGVVGSNVHYAPFMELGTRPHWPPLAALEGWARRHGTTAYVVARAIARRGLKPRHYLRRALESNQGKIIQIFNSFVKRVVK
jgi:HK97 gp10 family phage protein